MQPKLKKHRKWLIVGTAVLLTATRVSRCLASEM